jgi:hypothetical protein
MPSVWQLISNIYDMIIAASRLAGALLLLPAGTCPIAEASLQRWDMIVAAQCTGGRCAAGTCAAALLDPLLMSVVRVYRSY